MPCYIILSLLCINVISIHKKMWLIFFWLIKCLAHNHISSLYGITLMHAFMLYIYVYFPSYSAVPPTAVLSPSLVSTISGQQVTLNCTATGRPTPTIAWWSNGISVPNQNTPRYQLAYGGQVLAISGATTADRGVIACTATNAAGSAQANATIQVTGRTDAPHILLPITADHNHIHRCITLRS